MTDRTQNRANRILVVDDEEAIRTIIVSMLAANYECREAASGLEALVLLESGEEIDLMLTDMLMDDMDGIALLERTKACFPSLPVVMVTAVDDISVALQALRNGAFDYVLKPFEREQLLATVRRALETSRLKLEHRAYVANLEAQVAALTEQLRGRRSSRSSRWAIFKSKFVASVLLLGFSVFLTDTALQLSTNLAVFAVPMAPDIPLGAACAVSPYPAHRPSGQLIYASRLTRCEL